MLRHVERGAVLPVDGRVNVGECRGVVEVMLNRTLAVFWVVAGCLQGAEPLVELGRFAGGGGAATQAAKAAGGASGAATGGVAFALDTGEKRVNWTHQRSRVVELDGPRDLRSRAGLLVEIHTQKPRSDVGVTIWVREADGSWYYVKDAVPLVDQLNRAEVLFEDFRVAEWVAPGGGSHLDEDDLLDTGSIDALAVGVVNPLGVGVVSFELVRLDLLDRAPRVLPAAELEVTGRWLSVNGHGYVPAGVFGGYAPDLVQEVRPGSQRYLHPSTTPRTPWRKFLSVVPGQVVDGRGIVRRLLGEEEGWERAGTHFAGLLDARTTRSLRGVKPDATAESVGRLVSGVLNRLLDAPGLYVEEALADRGLSKELLEALARAGEAQGAGGMERLRLRRGVLDELFAGLLRRVEGTGPSEAFLVDCLGERKEPAWMLSSADWEKRLDAWGRSFAERARASGEEVHFEFWNEPYLNWAERSRVNLQDKWFADRVEGSDAVRLRHTPEVVVPHFRWARHGDGWRVEDATAFSYWSGRGNGWIYDRMLGVIGPAIKQVNPEVQVVAGWGFRWNEDHWAAWDMLYKPTIDRNIGWIDGVHEHHYQGDPTAMHGTYEMLTAYGVSAHGKWLYSYNTETNDLLDAPARGSLDTPEKVSRATTWRRVVYNVRDCLYACLQSPDKLRARAVIHPEREGWAGLAYGFMRNMRGRLVETRSSCADVWCIASIDGTDPRAMPADGSTGRSLVVAVVNDRRTAAEIGLVLRAPTGMRFAGAGVREWMCVDDDFAVTQHREETRMAAEGGRLVLELAPRGMWKVTLPLEGDPVAEVQVHRRQWFADAVLARVVRGEVRRMVVRPDEGRVKSAGRGWLRLVVEQVAEGEGWVEVNGRRLELPKAMTADNQTRIVEIGLEAGDLKSEMELVFGVHEGNFAGYLVCMASVVLEESGK